MERQGWHSWRHGWRRGEAYPRMNGESKEEKLMEATTKRRKKKGKEQKSHGWKEKNEKVMVNQFT